MSSGTTLEGDVLLTPREAAHALKLAVNTLAVLRTRGGGPPFVKLSSRAVRYSRVDLQEWVGARRRRSTADTGIALNESSPDNE